MGGGKNMNDLRKQLVTISRNRLDEINQLLADPKNPTGQSGLLEVVKAFTRRSGKDQSPGGRSAAIG